MQQFFNWPIATMTWVLGLVTAGLLCGCLFLAWRTAVLRQLGLRNIGRRPLRAVLIVAGLMLSTTVIGTAFGTGDTITHTLRGLITGSLGNVDEVVARSPRRVRLDQQAAALTQPGLGALAIAKPDFFDQAEGEHVAQAVHASQVIAGVLPAIIDQVTVVHAGSQQLQSNVALLAVPSDYPASFGLLSTGNGTRVSLSTLAADEVVLNTAAAEALGAQAGEPLDLLRNGEQWSVRIHAVVQNNGLGGAEPLLIVPLVHYQQVTQHLGQINQLLVANRGGPDSIVRSPGAARELRTLLVNRTAAENLHTLIASPEVQRDLLIAEGIVDAPTRLRLMALRAEALQPTLTDHFIDLISEPRTRQRLFRLARGLPTTDRSTAFNALQTVTTLSVLEIKQIALDQASEYGAVITTIFLVLGIFSIAAAILLIFLIFALLAADRGVELATMRAIGMRRRQIMTMFMLEGMVYNLLGALLGTLASAGSSYALVWALGRTLEPFGVRLDLYLAPGSLLLTWCIGVLLTFGLMLWAAWRVSATEVMAGVRGEAGSVSRTALGVGGALMLLIALLVWYKWRAPADLYVPRSPLLLPLMLSLIVGGLTCSLCTLLRERSFLDGRDLPGALATLAGLVTIAIWLRALAQLTGLTGDTSSFALTLAIAGIVLICATVWTGVRSLGPLLLGLDYLLSALPRLRAVVRPAAGYLGYQRWRTGLTVVMFGMVILTMVLASTLIQVAVNAYAGSEPPVGGYDLRGDVHGTPLGDLNAALATARAVKANDFTATGSLATQEATIIQLGLAHASWQSANLVIVDDAFLRGVQVGLQQRAPGYTSDTAIWNALRQQPGTAVVLDRDSSIVTSDLTHTSGHAMFTLWARPISGGRPTKLNVIGLVDSRAELDPGIYISQATATSLGSTLPAPSTYFFAVGPGIRAADALAGLQLSFADRGLAVTDLQGTFRLLHAFRLLLLQVVQGFLGLGLLAGIAALGLLGVQAVRERRQQLGMLRALGFTRGQIQATLACESGVIAGLGIAVGLALGLLLAKSLVDILAARYGGLLYSVPWREIGLTVMTAWVGSLFAILLTALQAGRVAPAEALRAGSE